jgi:protein-tyrosine phosphatase
VPTESRSLTIAMTVVSMTNQLQPIPEATKCIICTDLHTNRFHDKPHRYCDACKVIRKKSKGTITRVFDVLYVSDMVGAAKFEGVRICVHERKPTYGTACHIPILEKPPNDDIDRTGGVVDRGKLYHICKEMDYHLANRLPLLVHCVGGVERSPLIFAYFLTTRNFQSSMENAYAYLKSIRPVVANRSFWLPDHKIGC